MGDPLDDGTAGDERGSGLPRETVDDVLARLPRELAGSRAKVERARKHLDELHVAIEAIDPTQFYRMVRDDDADAGVSTWRFRILRELPDVWGVVIGEFGYQLRSSLDLAVHQLAVADSGAPGRKTAFPIFSDAQNYAGQRPTYLEGVHEAHWAIFDTLQPYLRGNAPFADLAWLTNTDQHQLLHPSFVMVGEQDLEFEIHAASPPFEEVTFGAPGQLLHDGAQMVYARSLGGLPRMNVKTRVTLDVAFGERGLQWGHIDTIGGRAVEALDDIGRLFKA